MNFIIQNFKLESIANLVSDQAIKLYSSLTQQSTPILVATSSIAASVILNNLQKGTGKDYSLFLKYCLKPIVTGSSTWAMSAIASQIAGYPLSNLFLVIASTCAVAASVLIEARKNWQDGAKKVNVVTLNVLGAASDPLEFSTDLGSQELNAKREAIAQLLIPEEFYWRKANPKIIEEAKARDQDREASLNWIFDDNVLDAIKLKLEEQKTKESEGAQESKGSDNSSNSEFELIIQFIEKYSDNQLFHFVKTHPGKILGLEQFLIKAGLFETLPTVNSTVLLDEKLTGLQLQVNLINRLFSQDVFDAIDDKALHKIRDSITVDVDGVSQDSIKNLLSTKSGLIFLYSLYQSIHLDIVENNKKIKDLNEIKKAFENKISNPQTRENWLLSGLSQHKIGVLFTQEATTLSEKVKNLFHDLKNQNQKDGTCVWLNKATWNEDYTVIESADEKINMVIATHTTSKEKYLLASLHGHSSKTENGRELIQRVVTEFETQQKTNPDLKLIIGTDANTKKPNDLQLLNELLAESSLQRTNIGLTTKKIRLVTTQPSKCLVDVTGEGDFIITLKKAKLSNVGKGWQTSSWQTWLWSFWKGSSIDDNQYLPSAAIPSDHYPVYATVEG